MISNTTKGIPDMVRIISSFETSAKARQILIAGNTVYLLSPQGSSYLSLVRDFFTKISNESRPNLWNSNLNIGRHRSRFGLVCYVCCRNLTLLKNSFCILFQLVFWASLVGVENVIHWEFTNQIKATFLKCSALIKASIFPLTNLHVQKKWNLRTKSAFLDTDDVCILML